MILAIDATCCSLDVCAAQCQEVNHRYANRDGKWQRVYDFKEHKVAHPMREMTPVFYQYTPEKEARDCQRNAANDYYHVH